jgi:hypothetical protein
MPRSYEFHGAPFEVEAAYSNHLGDGPVGSALERMVDDAYEERDTTADANMNPDGYGLPRPLFKYIITRS